ncbi:hypothetical protein AUC71_09975 [Methyloceanibacter marginalis]|uniref:Uncharacterized protein n=1 Tax=Methyloceanibacter marginalis TaxID=1774971 RepID=A0A1E3WCU4_9HYPH|nr:hypothetical protein [Methyloceanibacter marginalis]ODS03352.1 hypothetical protein AUC71_09975 [Methyloceanibacter marginalis]
MTNLDAAYAYTLPRAPARGLSESAQRVLMALIGLALLEMLLLPNPLLTHYTGYAEPGGGNPLFKVHFYSYTLFLALLFVTANVGGIRFLSTQTSERPGVVQFAVVVMFCAAVTIARQASAVWPIWSTRFSPRRSLSCSFPIWTRNAGSGSRHS